MVAGHDGNRETHERTPRLQWTAALPALYGALPPHLLIPRPKARQHGSRVPVRRVRQAHLGRGPEIARGFALTRALRIRPRQPAFFGQVERRSLQICQAEMRLTPGTHGLTTGREIFCPTAKPTFIRE